MHASAFDALAADYDAAFTDTALGGTLRRFVWDRIDVCFEGAARVLDLGCGTGEDAMRLAASGRQVVALDASAAMVQQAREKARARGLSTQVSFHCAPMERLGEVLRMQRFDAALSNFGALNCVEDLPRVIADLAQHLHPGARLLWVPMGRYVPWEWAWYLLRGQPARARRRLSSGRLPWRGLTLAYPTPRQLTSLLAPHFRIERVRPLGVALPPTFAAEWLGRSPRTLALLTRLERAAQRWSALASCSDHYIVEATRRTS